MVQSKEMQYSRLHRKRLTRVAVEIREQGQKNFRGDYSIQVKGDSAGGMVVTEEAVRKGEPTRFAWLEGYEREDDSAV